MSRISASLKAYAKTDVLKAYAKTAVSVVFDSNLTMKGRELFIGSGAWSNPAVRFWDKSGSVFRTIYYNTSRGHFAVQTPNGSGFLPNTGLNGGKLGQYVFARRMDGAMTNINWTVQGSKLKPASADADTQDTALAGTYRCLGYVEANNDQSYGSTATLWQRID